MIKFEQECVGTVAVKFVTKTGAELDYGSLWHHTCSQEWVYFPETDCDLDVTQLTQIIAKLKELNG